MTPSLIAADRLLEDRVQRSGHPVGPSAAGKVIERVVDLNPRQPFELLEPGHLVVIEDRTMSSAIWRQLSGLGFEQDFLRRRLPVRTEVTSSSRIASSGGFVTWAKSCWK